MGLFVGNRRNSAQPGGYDPAAPLPPATKSGPHATIQSRAETQLSDELMKKHEESKRTHPRVHLTRGEYVIMEVRRHPIGLISAWFVSIFLALLSLSIIPIYGLNRDAFASLLMLDISKLPTAASLALPLFALAVLFVASGYISAYVYKSNLFYLTNESIIQYIQTSLFATRQQQINLVNVDDVSYKQNGILQQVLNYGTLHVTTEGDGNSSYDFPFVASPQKVTHMVNDAMEEATGFAVRYRQHHVEDETPKHF